MWERAGPPLLRVGGTPEPEGRPATLPLLLPHQLASRRTGGGVEASSRRVQIKPVSLVGRVKAPGGSRGISGARCACMERPPTRLHPSPPFICDSQMSLEERARLPSYIVPFPRLPYNNHKPGRGQGWRGW